MGGSVLPPVQTYGVSWGVPTVGSSGGDGVQKGDFKTLQSRVTAIEKELKGQETSGAGGEGAVGRGEMLAFRSNRYWLELMRWNRGCQMRALRLMGTSFPL